MRKRSVSEFASQNDKDDDNKSINLDFNNNNNLVNIDSNS